MFGLFTYWLVCVGLGGYVQRFLFRDPTMMGASFAFGAALVMTLYPLMHILLGLSLKVAVYVLVVLAIGGILCWVDESRRHKSVWRDLLIHPMIVLPIVVLLVILIGGGGYVDYLPFTVDEFANWVGVSREIYLLGDYAAHRHDFHLDGYYPGWRLWMVLPWFLKGDMDFGHVAVAPLILHIAAYAILYDLLYRLLSLDCYADGRSLRTAAAWLICAVVMTAQGMGLLWSYTSLVEQPQIYLGVMVLAWWLLRDVSLDTHHWPVAAGISIATAGGVMVKSPGVLMACAAFVVILIERWRARALFSAKSLGLIALSVGPALAIHFWWSSGVQSASCLASPINAFRGNTEAAQAGMAIWDVLAWRFLDQTWTWISSYKSPVSMVALVGWTMALYRGWWRALGVLVLFAGAYFLAIYAFHVFCFGPYYFETLNSIPRFSRVPIQMFQAIGLVLALCLIASWALPRTLEIADTTLCRRTLWVCVSVLLALLFGFQVYTLDQSREDVTYRTAQNVDWRVMEMFDLVKEAHQHSRQDRKLSMIVVDQPGDSSHKVYLQLFNRYGDETGLSWVFGFDSRYTWSSSVSPEEFRADIQQMDIIWPMRTDPWQQAVLNDIVGEECISGEISQMYLLRDIETSDWHCVRKPNDGSNWSINNLPQG